MFTFTKDKNGKIRNFTFKKPLEYFHVPHTWEIEHERLAKEYSQKPWKYLTAIVRTEQLNEKLWNDPKHAHTSYEVWVSEVESEARRRMMNNFFTEEQVEEIFKDNNFPKERYNWDEEDSEEEKNIETELKDAIYDAQVKMLYPSIIEEFKEECRYEYDKKLDEEIKLSKKDFEKKWKKRQLEIFLPRVHEEVDRVFPNTPEPFEHTTYISQYFFIEKEENIEWAMGCSSGSHTRYTQGLMGHLFATLTKKYKKSIPTYFFKNTKNNDFKFIQEWKTLKLDRHELTGNYPMRREQSEPLVKGLLFEMPISEALQET